MYTPTIGLEVHAELKTNSKMFCGCKNDPHAGEPNTYICPICTGHPGTLPTPNQSAIKHVLTFGVAVGGKLATYSEFDRKNYFYPDIPKAYQLSQYAFPFVSGGTVAGVELTRVHLEEDTARSQHDKGDESLVDYNRAGVPLMELVTEPVIHDAETAGAFAKELQLLLRTINISDANMEKGEMRVEANISVSKTEQFGTKVEVKNLNSFRSVMSAIDYEVKRQIAVLENGGVVNQETRGWDEENQETYVQRTKETAKDYRYFPDPDLTKFNITEINDFSDSNLKQSLPDLPELKRSKYSVLGLTSSTIETIIQNNAIETYINALYDGGKTTGDVFLTSVNYFLTDLLPAANVALPNEIISPTHFLNLMKLVATKKVTSRVAKDIITEFANQQDVDLLQIIHDRGLVVDFTQKQLEEMASQVVADNPSVVSDYRAGKEAALQFLIGQIMKKTRGTANPESVAQTLRGILDM